MVQLPYWSQFEAYVVTHAFSLFAALLILVVGGAIILIINRVLARFFARTKYDETLEKFAQRGFAVFLWTILLIVIFANLGFDVTGFIAGLGIVGFIIGFATKDIFSNIAAGLLILVSKPFKVRDEVEVVGMRGTVQEISLSFCTLIDQENVLVIMPNAKVWGSPIKNFSRMKRPENQKIQK